MRSIINLITVAFVIGALWFAGHNVKLQNLVKNYTRQTQSEVESLTGDAHISFSLKSILDSFENLMNIGGMEGDTGQIEQVVTPGPLNKIPEETETKIPTKTVSTTSTTKSPETIPSTTTTAPIPVGSLALTVSGILKETNTQRVANGAAAVTSSKVLDASAQVKAEDILKRQYFEHQSPDGRTVSDLVADQGYVYIKIGENLALGNFKSDVDVVTAWMNSPGHRANIVDPQFKEMGVGVAYGMYQGHNVYVAVQHFGRPRSACPVITPGLKESVETGQAKLTEDANTLQAMKVEIDKARSEGKDVNAEVKVYNEGVEKYQADYAKVDALRIEYNNQVYLFNQCINSTN